MSAQLLFRSTSEPRIVLNSASTVQELKESYESELLSYLPNPEDSLAAALLYVVLSSHAPNEEYLDHKIPQWIDVSLLYCP